jgi:serine/threonine protein kinase
MGSLPATIGHYRVIRQLGEGGMGTVFEAVHETIERRVAIKVLRPEFAHVPDIAIRFVNEARAVNRVVHPGIVQISEYGHLPDGTAYIVMEYLSGETLEQHIQRRGGTLALAEVLYLGGQVAEALAAAHAKGIIHRELSMENLRREISRNSDQGMARAGSAHKMTADT